MDYWKELNIFESVMQENINNNNLLKLRSCADICSALIANSKYAMCVGRTNRAWALLLMAKSHWETNK